MNSVFVSSFIFFIGVSIVIISLVIPIFFYYKKYCMPIFIAVIILGVLIMIYGMTELAAYENLKDQQTFDSFTTLSCTEQADTIKQDKHTDKMFEYYVANCIPEKQWFAEERYSQLRPETSP